MTRKFNSIQELADHLDELRRNQPWYVKLYYWYLRRIDRVTHIPGRVVNVLQRARYGFGYQDLWSFDTYIAGVISKATADLADETYSYPSEFIGSGGHAGWQNYLRSISDDLKLYGVRDSDMELAEDGETVYERAQDAMQRFTDKFGSMYD